MDPADLARGGRYVVSQLVAIAQVASNKRVRNRKMVEVRGVEPLSRER